jgi:hypothetical protein
MESPGHREPNPGRRRARSNGRQLAAFEVRRDPHTKQIFLAHMDMDKGKVVAGASRG